MGDTGMGEMFEMSHHMPRPINFLPFGSPGPFGLIDMSGMFTIVKVREGITNYNDPGWYAHPSNRATSEPSSPTELMPPNRNHDQMQIKGEITHHGEMPAAHTHNAKGLELGNLHPLLLHFPIVLFFIAFVFDFLFLIKAIKEPFNLATHWIIIIAAILAIPTVLTGLYAVKLGHADNPYVLIHKNWALSTLIYSVGHAFFRSYVLRRRKIFSAYIFVLISLVNLSLVSITAEYGGMVTRGKGPLMYFFHRDSVTRVFTRDIL
jgi:uncharacterized membrane protein